MKYISIALDGPAGAGKSSVAGVLSKAFDAIHLDTGAMYRAVGMYMLRNGISLKDTEAIAAKVGEVPLDVRFSGGKQCVFLGDEDVTQSLRLPEISMASSAVAVIPEVREHLVRLQRKICESKSVLMDGRDIGTVVLPNATVKIYLTASAEARAKRRVDQNEKDGIHEPYEKVLAEIIQRDEQDMNRTTSPLRMAEDAVLVDSTELTQEETQERVLAICREAIEKANA